MPNVTVMLLSHHFQLLQPYSAVELTVSRLVVVRAEYPFHIGIRDRRWSESLLGKRPPPDRSTRQRPFDQIQSIRLFSESSQCYHDVPQATAKNHWATPIFLCQAKPDIARLIFISNTRSLPRELLHERAPSPSLNQAFPSPERSKLERSSS